MGHNNGRPINIKGWKRKEGLRAFDQDFLWTREVLILRLAAQLDRGKRRARALQTWSFLKTSALQLPTPLLFNLIKAKGVDFWAHSQWILSKDPLRLFTNETYPIYPSFLFLSHPTRSCWSWSCVWDKQTVEKILFHALLSHTIPCPSWKQASHGFWVRPWLREILTEKRRTYCGVILLKIWTAQNEFSRCSLSGSTLHLPQTRATRSTVRLAY